MLVKNTSKFCELVPGRPRLCANEFDNMTLSDGGSVEKTIQTKQSGQRSRADVHLRILPTGSCFTTPRHKASQSLSPMPLELACGYWSRRQDIRLSWADGAHCRLGPLQRRVGHCAPLQEMPDPADQPNRRRRQRTGPDFVGPATFGPPAVPIRWTGAEN